MKNSKFIKKLTVAAGATALATAMTVSAIGVASAAGPTNMKGAGRWTSRSTAKIVRVNYNTIDYHTSLAYEGAFYANDKEDYYKITVPEDQSIVVEGLTGSSYTSDYVITFAGYLNGIGYDSNVESYAVVKLGEKMYLNLKKGTHFIKVTYKGSTLKGSQSKNYRIDMYASRY